MTDAEFLQEMLNMGKITQDRYDKGVVKLQTKTDAKAKYKKDKAKLTKTEQQAILDILVN